MCDTLRIFTLIEAELSPILDSPRCVIIPLQKREAGGGGVEILARQQNFSRRKHLSEYSGSIQTVTQTKMSLSPFLKSMRCPSLPTHGESS